MTDALKPYPAYKDSGLPWLGRIPAHWGERRAKYLFREVDERSDTGREELLSVSHMTGVTPRSQKNVTMFMAESYVGHKVCCAGDLIINTMWAWMAALGVAKQAGIVSPSYAVYRPLQPDAFVPDFVDHLLRTRAYQSEYVCRSTGIRASRLRLYPEKFLDILIVCPPYKEQQKLTAYLHAKDRSIRRYIRTKQKLITLLNERKQALIRRAVTRGLDPHVRLKPSGVDWLGEVPEHWEVVALRHLGTRFGSGMTPRGGATVYQTSGIPLIRSQNVHFDGLRLGDVVFISDEIHSSMSGTHVKSGDVLLNITGASIGRVCVAPDGLGEANVNQHVTIIRPRVSKVTPGFLAAFLSSPFIQGEITMSAYGAAREGLPMGDMKALRILVPPLREQTQIVDSLRESTEQIHVSIRAIQREIDLIREYRTRLIADVVTGKVDVREAAASLPEVEEAEPPEVEPLEEAPEDGVEGAEEVDDADE